MKPVCYLAIFAIVFVSGCATISNTTKQKVNVRADDGSTLVADINGKKFKIPGEVSVPRGQAVIQILSSDNKCYENTQTVILMDSVSNWFWVNTLSIGIGSITDVVSGGMWVYSNPHYVVYAKKKANCKL